MKTEDVMIAREMLTSRLYSEYFDEKTPRKYIENLLSEAIITEENRLKKSKNTVNKQNDIKYWKEVKKLYYQINYDQKKEILKEVIEKYFNEIVGKFDINVYSFVYNILNSILPFMYSKRTIFEILNPFIDREELNTIEIKGYVDQINNLIKKGTVILVPTHSSNLDSMIVGIALGKAGLPPFLYGAGINLYTNPILAFFMERIGAYTVDREKTHTLYKNVLKEFATITMELGYHNIFFPNGGRSRSNIVDNKLKLGLLGSAFNAYINNINNKNPKPNIYIIPATINYHITLEAKSMIQEHLKKTTKNVIIDDKPFKEDKIVDLLIKTLKSTLKAYFNIAPAMDIFGNKVDYDGNSIDKEGNIIDIKNYIFDENGKYISSEPKNQIYVKNLGEKIVDAYYDNNIVFSNNILAFVVYHTALNNLSNTNTEEENQYKTLKLIENQNQGIPIDIIYKNVEVIYKKLKEMETENKIVLADEIKSISPQGLVEKGLQIFSIYNPKIISMNNATIFIHDVELLYYYNNRLENYSLDELI